MKRKTLTFKALIVAALIIVISLSITIPLLIIEKNEQKSVLKISDKEKELKRIIKQINEFKINDESIKPAKIPLSTKYYKDRFKEIEAIKAQSKNITALEKAKKSLMDIINLNDEILQANLIIQGNAWMLLNITKKGILNLSIPQPRKIQTQIMQYDGFLKDKSFLERSLDKKTIDDNFSKWEDSYRITVKKSELEEKIKDVQTKLDNFYNAKLNKINQLNEVHNILRGLIIPIGDYPNRSQDLKIIESKRTIGLKSNNIENIKRIIKELKQEIIDFSKKINDYKILKEEINRWNPRIPSINVYQGYENDKKIVKDKIALGKAIDNMADFKKIVIEVNKLIFSIKQKITNFFKKDLPNWRKKLQNQKLPKEVFEKNKGSTKEYQKLVADFELNKKVGLASMKIIVINGRFKKNLELIKKANEYNNSIKTKNNAKSF